VGDLLLHPGLPLFAAAAVAWFLPDRVGRIVMVAAPVTALVALAQLDTGTAVTAIWLDFDLVIMRADALAVAFAWVFVLAAGIAGLFGWSTMHARERSAALAYAGAGLGVVLAGDLLTFFVLWEIKAIASTFVILLRRGGNSGRAGMRYLFVHILGGKLLLAGVLWHLAETGSLLFVGFDVGPAGVLILLACLVSAAVPPLNAWLPDAYPEASVAGTVFLSAYTTKAAVYALARGFAGWDVLIWLGVAMALYGVVYAVLENDVRRLLAYHIISQVGYMVAAVGIGTELALNGATAHAFAHILYKGLLLMGVGAVIHATGRAKMTELGGIANRMRGVLALYMVGAVSISSFPLFSGFVSKELAVQGASAAGLGLVVVLLKIASVGTFLHTGLKLPYGTWFGTQGAGPRTNDGARLQVGAVPTSMYVAMGISAALNLALGVRPALLYDLLPYVVDYSPYSLGKVVETSQVLLFTAVASWLLIGKLGADPKVSVDTDWVYRRLPLLVGARLQRTRVTAEPDRAGDASPGPFGRVARRLSPWPYDLPPPVATTWAMGSIVLWAAVLFLGLTLVVSS
jgi:multicomponent Na+:H+ antiporter subunit D